MVGIPESSGSIGASVLRQGCTRHGFEWLAICSLLVWFRRMRVGAEDRFSLHSLLPTRETVLLMNLSDPAGNKSSRSPNLSLSLAYWERLKSSEGIVGLTVTRATC